ncbi:MAG: DUF1566 domain-containing protein [Candidatus Woesearchaeota archaeon]|jgi:hypothetical protein|nr:DUF1566 domain-containing protein [Candidatus Woesearchaeota archaeon]
MGKLKFMNFSMLLIILITISFVSAGNYVKLDSNGNELPDSASSWAMVKDFDTELIWQSSTNFSSYTVGEANSYCNNLAFANYSDWHLPVSKEFVTILNYELSSALNTDYFSLSGNFWSIEKPQSLLQIIYHLPHGDTLNSMVPMPLVNVMCVRDNYTQLNDFVINNEFTVTDINTGLTWQRYHDDVSRTLDEAVENCQNLSFGGIDNWRLPSVKELYTIIDFSLSSNVKFNQSIFTNYQYDRLYTSNILSDITYAPSMGTQIWFVSWDGNILYSFSTSNIGVCVAGNDDDSDGVYNSEDICPNTGLETMTDLNSGKYMLYEGFPYFMTPVDNYLYIRPYTLFDTNGCSCSQILALKGKGITQELVSGCKESTLIDFITLNN